MSISAVRSLAVSVVAAAILVSGLPPGAAPASVEAVSPNIVISQVYGGGGNSGATLKNDFIELFNRGASAIDVTGWSVQYTSSSGTTWTNKTDLGADVIPAGGYYLVQQAAQGGGTVDLPPPDATGNIAMSGTAGKVALVNNTTALTGSCPTGVVDFVGYGTAANCFEGTGPTATLNNTTAALRDEAGCTDTDDNSTDFSTGAPAPRNSDTTAAPCGPPVDEPPTVASTDPDDGDTDVGVDADVEITFSEPVTVADGWFTISCTESGGHSATETDGPTTYTLDPSTDFDQDETCTVTIHAELVSDQDGTPDEMEVDHAFSFETIGDVCEDTFTSIHDIQGDGDASPLVGQTVSTRGVVTGDFVATDGTGLSGFFLQDADGDGDTTTSDGVFVYMPSANEFADADLAVGDDADLAVGDEVHVRGNVKEHNTLTELDFIDILVVCSAGNTIAPTDVTLPAPVDGDLERYEGMLITIDQEMTVAQNFFLGRYGQLSLSSQGRLYQPTNSLEPGSPEFEAERDLNARRLLILDDGRDNSGNDSQNPDPIPYIGRNRTIRAGDTVQSLTGNLDFGQISSTSSIRDYRLQPTEEPEFERVNHRRARPPQLRGQVTVASFNVLNYFTTIDEAGAECTGPDSNPRDNCRGADSDEEFERQKTKIVGAIVAIDADVVGLIEIENNGDVAVQDLVDGLNAEYGYEAYAVVAEPATGAGIDAIRQALIYKPDSLALVGASTSDTDTAHDRPPIAQTFRHTRGQVFSVIVNHFKSKGCTGADGLDEDQGDGQSCYNATRVNQAEALVDFIEEVTTTAGDEDVLVIGDLNAYGAEDPIEVLRDAGLVDQLARYNPDPYTYIFDGQSGYLDHALSSASLSHRVTGAQEWHINADEPSVIDYNLEFKPQDLYRPNAFRSSDHDPVILGLNVGRASPAYPRNASAIDGTHSPR